MIPPGRWSSHSMFHIPGEDSPKSLHQQKECHCALLSDPHICLWCLKSMVERSLIICFKDLVTPRSGICLFFFFWTILDLSCFRLAWIHTRLHFQVEVRCFVNNQSSGKCKVVLIFVREHFKFTLTKSQTFGHRLKRSNNSGSEVCTRALSDDSNDMLGPGVTQDVPVLSKAGSCHSHSFLTCLFFSNYTF